MAITPVGPEPAETYVGRTSQFTVQFRNERKTEPVLAFPEPPLTVTRLAGQGSCDITEGGIWVRRHVYAGSNGKVLAVHEYTGDNDTLVFYDTASCRRRAAIDLSRATWRLASDAVVLEPQAPGAVPILVPLGRDCLPRHRSGKRVSPSR